MQRGLLDKIYTLNVQHLLCIPSFRPRPTSPCPICGTARLALRCLRCIRAARGLFSSSSLTWPPFRSSPASSRTRIRPCSSRSLQLTRLRLCPSLLEIRQDIGPSPSLCHRSRTARLSIGDFAFFWRGPLVGSGRGRWRGCASKSGCECSFDGCGISRYSNRMQVETYRQEHLFLVHPLWPLHVLLLADLWQHSREWRVRLLRAYSKVSVYRQEG